MEKGVPGQQVSGRLFDILGWIVVNRAVTASTASGYISAIAKYLRRSFGLEYKRSQVFTDFMARFQQFPREKQARVPATKRLIAAVVADPAISQATRVAVLLGFRGVFRASE